jgi:hypothetical protein
MTKKLAFDKEIDRVDRLLSKWGICVGNLGDAKAKRRELAVTLARCHPGVFTDVVFEVMVKEARLRGLKAVQLWIYGLLSDEVERGAYLPELLREAATAPPVDAGEPGFHMRIHPGTPGYLELEAEKHGTTISEESYIRQARWMYARYRGDGWTIARVAEESKVTRQFAREQISAEFVIQTGETLEQWETNKSKKKAPPTPRDTKG